MCLRTVSNRVRARAPQSDLSLQCQSQYAAGHACDTSSTQSVLVSDLTGICIS